MIRPVRFTAADSQQAWETWGSNCGPGALAAIADLTLDQVRPLLDGFDRKGYTNPRMMRAALDTLSLSSGLGYSWRVAPSFSAAFPRYGLARVQWNGPWTKPGVPMAARYRHTHWVGARTMPDDDGGEFVQVFDVNCMLVGGWISAGEWTEAVVPWLLKKCEPKATGGWWLTHTVDVTLPGVR